jgi:hypothetical protein
MKTATATGRFVIENERDFNDLLSDLGEMMRFHDGHEAITSPQLLASYLDIMTDGFVEEIEKSIEDNEVPYRYYSQTNQKFFLVDGYLAPCMREQVAQSLGLLFEDYLEKFTSE